MSADSLFGILAGIGLAAACGFRVFVPLLVISAAAFAGRLSLAPGFDWLGGLPALVALSTATIMEVIAYYVPWLDHLLDLLVTPVALLAGVLAMAATVTVTNLPPGLHWLVILVGGAGSAGLVQGATVLLRLKSTALTGGFGNPVVSTIELFGAVTTALLALAAPLICVGLLVLVCGGIFRLFRRVVFGHLGGGSEAATTKS
ncbi:MAG: DUF4126 domain-containing protein [Gemmatimonadota bacterium]